MMLIFAAFVYILIDSFSTLATMLFGIGADALTPGLLRFRYLFRRLMMLPIAVLLDFLPVCRS